MSERYLPEELTYRPEPQPENVVSDRHETWLQNPVPEFTANGTNTIRFQINTTNFVDLASINLTAKIFAKKTGNQTVSDTEVTVPLKDGTFSTHDIHLNDTFSLFQEITLSTGNGTVIEQLNDVVALAEIVKSLSFSEGYLNSTGSYFNAQQIRSRRTGYAYGSGTYSEETQDPVWEIPILKLLGFLNTGKIVRPSTFGGLVFSVKMAPSVQCWTAPGPLAEASSNPTSTTVDYTLRQVRIYYDEIVGTESYIKWYNDNYETRGFRLMMDTYTHTSSTENGSLNKTVRLPISAKRCKGLITVLRPTNSQSNAEIPSQRFLSSEKNHFRYQYMTNGVRYPPSPVQDYMRAHAECLKLCSASHDAQRDHGCSLINFSRNYVSGGSNSDEVDVNFTKGKFMMAVSLEKLGGEKDTGIVIDPSTTSLEFSMAGPSADNNWSSVPHPYDLGDAPTFLVSTFALHAASVTVSDGRVLVEY